MPNSHHHSGYAAPGTHRSKIVQLPCKRIERGRSLNVHHSETRAMSADTPSMGSKSHVSLAETVR